jgi:putative NADH-flavin reductase
MKIMIFGASGATGQHLVLQALNRKHSVSAFVRDPSKFQGQNDSIRIIKGDVGDYQNVEDAITNHDAVLSALGASTPFRRDFTLVKGIQNITTAMMKKNVKAFIYQSFLGVKEDRNELGFLINHILPLALKNIITDHEAKEDMLIQSNLKWTIVRCPVLTNGPFTNNYRDGEHITSSSLLPSISRADVADFMLRQLEDHKYVRKKPRIMY